MEAHVDEMISNLQEEMNYLMAVKKWNALKKTVNTEHVWAVPRKNTKEYEEVKAMYAPKAPKPTVSEPATKPKSIIDKFETERNQTGFFYNDENVPYKYVVPKRIDYNVKEPAPLPKHIQNPKVTYSMINAGNRDYNNVQKVFINDLDLVEEVRQLKGLTNKRLKEWDENDFPTYYKMYGVKPESTRDKRHKQVIKLLEDQLIELVNKNI
jgi:hypothetical protein